MVARISSRGPGTRTRNRRSTPRYTDRSPRSTWRAPPPWNSRSGGDAETIHSPDYHVNTTALAAARHGPRGCIPGIFARATAQRTRHRPRPSRRRRSGKETVRRPCPDSAITAPRFEPLRVGNHLRSCGGAARLTRGGDFQLEDQMPSAMQAGRSIGDVSNRTARLRPGHSPLSMVDSSACRGG
jgi:hypothetical protein